MTKANSKFTKEMDLGKFIHRQRVMATALLGLLSGNQATYINKVSQIIVRESSNTETSEDDELDYAREDIKTYVSRMVYGNNKVDKKLIDAFRVRKADQLGLSFNGALRSKAYLLKLQD